MPHIIVTGGCSFIGSHLVDRLVLEGHDVVVLDDLSSGKKENLASNVLRAVRLFPIDLRTHTPASLVPYFKCCDLLYHLAADHGGRGYVETRQMSTSNNFAIDNNVIQAAIQAKVGKVIYASSGCVYPSFTHPLLEGDVVGALVEPDQIIEEADDYDRCPTGYSPDGLYGLAKLAGELTLQQAHKEFGLSSVSCRFFTVFGPRAKENHAIISFIARAFIKQPIWTVWGDGSQVRDWTYVDDIVDGLLFARSPSCPFAINLGTPEHFTVDQAVNLVLESVREKEGYHDYFPEIHHDPSKPVGPRYRVGDSSLYLGLSKTRFTPFRQALAATIEWYWQTHDRERVAADFERLLIERK